MRKIIARELRETAAKIAETRQHPVHVANGEERAYRDERSFMSFTKGLPHSEENGLVRDDLDPVRLRTAIDNGYTRDFDLGVPLGDRQGGSALQWHFFSEDTDHRKWEAPTAGCVFDLQGPDAQAVTMPPAPSIVTQNQPDPASYHTTAHGVGVNPELVAEMSEVYWLALLRDRHLSAFDNDIDVDADDNVPVSDADAVQEAVNHLDELEFYRTARGKHPRRRLIGYEHLDRQNLFRGHTQGDRKGPYLSQFMLMGDHHLGKVDKCAKPPIDQRPHQQDQGYLQYGSVRIDLRVRTAQPGKDYMTHWNEWLDVQNGADVGSTQHYADSSVPSDPAPFRFITTPRDLATYVHFDALYEAYLNACLWLLNAGAPFDPNFRHLLGETRHTIGFALYGGPHILSLMTEVATRGLKAVRFQKFNNHLRLRPEALAGLIAAQSETALEGKADSYVGFLKNALDQGIGGANLLQKIRDHNADQNMRHSAYLGDPIRSPIAASADLPLLPMAFPEGSPMHPSYGAGHATVAGACVTILKAFFDEEACLVRHADGSVKAVSPGDVKASDEKVAFVPNSDGSALEDRVGAYGDFLRIGDELNKLAANISIARNMAGVHYYSDYIDSLRMGEEIAIGVLQEQSIMYPKDPFQVSLTSFDDKRLIIGDGEVQCLDPDTGHEHDHLDSKSLLALLGHDRQYIADANGEGSKAKDAAA